MRKKVKELKESAQVALRQGGSSYEWLCKLEEDCRAMGLGRQAQAGKLGGMDPNQ
ncbi:hypothetical protein SAY87_005746 [Trapa incisa]|nr:hypothetical protein SAY87_005746 [Trapa incisa]